MLRPYTITIPTPLGATQALYSPAPDRKGCLIIVEDPAYNSSRTLSRALRCLSAASRLRGIAVLRLPCRPAEEMARGVFDVLGALRVVKAWGGVRSAIILPEAYREALFGKSDADALLDEVLATIATGSLRSTEALTSIRELVRVIPRLLESVTGIAVVQCLPQADASGASAVMCHLHSTCKHGIGRWSASAAANAPRRVESAMLDALSRWYTSGLMDEEMSWKSLCAVIRGTAGLASEKDAVPAGSVYRQTGDYSSRATFRLGLYWLDQQFEQVVAHLAERDAERAHHILSVVLPATADGVGHAYRAAKLSWRDLDNPARTEWLRACSQLSRTMAPA